MGVSLGGIGGIVLMLVWGFCAGLVIGLVVFGGFARDSDPPLPRLREPP